METMKIAVASSDGVNVDQHFGQAKQFLIYKATPTAFKLLVPYFRKAVIKNR